jgi:ATP-dependent DNA helicase RecQ
MGIDKKDIRNVIHYNAARNLEEYSQQVGRGGRDGLSCNCLLLFDTRDIASYKVSFRQQHCGQTDKDQSEIFFKFYS